MLNVDWGPRARMCAAGLLQLPADLLSHVLKHTCLHDLSALSRTCIALRDAAAAHVQELSFIAFERAICAKGAAANGQASLWGPAFVCELPSGDLVASDVASDSLLIISRDGELRRTLGASEPSGLAFYVQSTGGRFVGPAGHLPLRGLQSA